MPGEAVRDLKPALAELRLNVASEPISHVPPTACAPALRMAISTAARSLGLSTRELPSGAGYGGVFIARTGPIGMIFVPASTVAAMRPKSRSNPVRPAIARVLAETLRLLG